MEPTARQLEDTATRPVRWSGDRYGTGHLPGPAGQTPCGLDGLGDPSPVRARCPMCVGAERLSQRITLRR